MTRRLAPIVFACLALAACDPLMRESLSTDVTLRGRTSTLAYKADPSFAKFMSGSAWRRLGRAEIRALDFVSGGQSLEWSARGAKGRVKVGQPFAIARSECRRFEHKVEGGGRRDAVSGVACRSEGGRWAYIS